jgi:hypothetical protein
MLEILFAIFLILHGLVHLLYLGHSQRVFALQPGMDWPTGSWAFSTVIGDEKTSWLAGAACFVIAAGFVLGGVALLAGQARWRPLIVGTAVLSMVVFTLLWDGRLHDLDDQGAVNMLINAAILAVVLLLQWPAA